ncbi:MAG: MoaD/ThiS family protein [Candidatus Woesearchaeota archaeon]
MEIYLERENKTLEVVFKGKVKDLLKKLKFNSEEVLVVRNEELLTEGDILKNSDKIKIMSVVSGG